MAVVEWETVVRANWQARALANCLGQSGLERSYGGAAVGSAGPQNVD